MVGSGSEIATLFAVALPAALLTTMQYSMVAPGISLGLVVPLIGSEITVLSFEMVSAAAGSRSRQVLVATEIGMIHQLKRAAPEIDFLAVNEKASCKYMKMITPQKLMRSLLENRDEVHVDAQTADRARGAVERMIAIGSSGGGGE